MSAPTTEWIACRADADGIFVQLPPAGPVFSAAHAPTEEELRAELAPAVKRVRWPDGEVRMVEGYLSPDGDFYTPAEAGQG